MLVEGESWTLPVVGLVDPSDELTRTGLSDVVLMDIAGAQEVLRIGRLSWQLRDDDNILMGRLENQLQHALHLAAERLTQAGRLDPGARFGPEAAGRLAEALRDRTAAPVELPRPKEPTRDGSPAPPGAGIWLG